MARDKKSSKPRKVGRTGVTKKTKRSKPAAAGPLKDTELTCSTLVNSIPKEAELEHAILSAIKEQMSMAVRPKTDKEVKLKAPETVYKPPRFSLSPETNTKLARMVQGLTNTRMSGQDLEIEASVGFFTPSGSFIPGLSSDIRYEEVLVALDELEVSKKESVQRVKVIQATKMREVYIIDEDYKQYDRKFLVKDDGLTDDPRWGLRIKKSVEKHMDGGDFEEQWAEHVLAPQASFDHTEAEKSVMLGIIRNRLRTTYEDFDPDTPFRGFKIDVSAVTETIIYSDGTTRVRKRKEFELELLSPDDIRRETSAPHGGNILEATRIAIENFLMFAQGVRSPDLLLDARAMGQVASEHNRLVDFGRPAGYQQVKTGYWNKPRNLKIDNMLTAAFSESYATIKFDGSRRSLLFVPSGTYLISALNPMDVVKVSNSAFGLEGSLFDTEVLFVEGEKPVIYVFDAMVLKGEGLWHKAFPKRRSAWEKALKVDDSNLSSTVIVEDYDVSSKVYWTKGSVYDRISDALLEIEEDPDFYEGYEDGLIVQPTTGDYSNSFTYKWKPGEKMTIDFTFIALDKAEIESLSEDPEDKLPNLVDDGDWLADLDEENVGDVYSLNVGKGRDLVPFKGSSRYPVTGYILVEDSNGLLNKEVVECTFEKDSKTFSVYRSRPDRNRPNNKDTAISVWTDIVNPIGINTLKGDTMTLMRRAHNIFKFNSLRSNLHAGESILDIGSGRGGDLVKWSKIRLEKVYVIEPNDENVEELLRRYEDGTYSMDLEIFKFGAQKAVKIAKNIKDLDSLSAVVSFFSMTFFFVEEKMFKGLVDTLSLLPLGGKFFGTVMDGGRVRKLLGDTEDGEYRSNRLDLEKRAVWSMERVGEFSDDPFGNEILIDLDDEGSMVRNQTEWLVDFDYVKKTLKKAGFILRSTHFLDKGEAFDALPEQSQAFSRLNRYFVFERKFVPKM